MNRRQYLGAAGTALATSVLAGCTGSGESSSEVFASVGASGLGLDVEFSEGADIREVNLIHEGELVNQATLEAGESRTSIRLVEYSYGEVKGMYPPGEHTLVATDADGEELEHDLTIEPASEIVNVGILEDYPRRLAFRVENDGTGPDALLDAVVTGEELPESFNVEDGASKRTLKAPSMDDGPLVHVPIPPGETVEIVPAEDFFTFSVAEDPDPGSDFYAGVEDLKEEWAGETTTVDVVVQAAARNLLADAEVRFGGEVEEQRGLGNPHSFTEPEVVDVATDTEEI